MTIRIPKSVLGRLLVRSAKTPSVPRSGVLLSTRAKDVVSQHREGANTDGVSSLSPGKASNDPTDDALKLEKPSKDNESKEEVKAACGDVDEDDEMEQEDMFVDPPDYFEFKGREWGGPRRGGRLPEPTRFGDWERKGRCSDF